MTTLRRAIMTTVQEQLYWNDVKEGDNLPEFELDLTWTKMVEQVSGSQDFYEVHHDPGFAREAGHDEIFYNTGFTQAALCRLLTDWIGTEGWVQKFSFQMRRMNIPDDKVHVRGVVTSVNATEGDTGSVTLDLWLENDRIGITTPAERTVLLPVRK